VSRRALAVSTLLAVLLAAPCFATTYWVSPTGTSGHTGADSTSNAKSLAWVNTNADSGDVIRFASGDYGNDEIKPLKNGRSNKRIRFYGFPQDPGAVRVANISFEAAKGSYCTAKWFRCTAGFDGCNEIASQGPSGDSLVNISCAVADGVGFTAKYSVFDSLTVTGPDLNWDGQWHWLGMGSVGSYHPSGNRLTNSSFTIGVNITCCAPTGDSQVLWMTRADSNVVALNTFTITVTSAFDYFFALEMYRSTYNQFQGNTWSLTMNATPGGTHAVIAYRDSSAYNRFVGNTITTTGPGNISISNANSGSFGSSCNHQYWGNNVIKIGTPASPAAFWWQNGSYQDTLEFNRISASGGTVLAVVGAQDLIGTLIRHNTFYTGGATVLDVSAAHPSSSPRLASNVYYGDAPAAPGSETVRIATGVGMDSAGVIFTRGSAASPASAIYNGSVSQRNSPGHGSWSGLSGKAVWGTPAFKDSSFATFNDSLTATSYARPPVVTTLADGYAGRLSPGDVLEPETVVTLGVITARPTQVLLSWISPANDVGGTTGTVTSYDMRFTTNSSYVAGFTSMTTIVGEPSPSPAGTAECMAVTGLTAGVKYYFVLRATDAAGNVSANSNTVVKTTPATGSTTLVACPTP